MSRKEVLYKEIGEELKQLRISHGMTQSEFATKFRLNIRTLQDWEQGRNKIPESTIYMIETIFSNEERIQAYENMLRTKGGRVWINS